MKSPKSKNVVIIPAVLVLAAGVLFFLSRSPGRDAAEVIREISPHVGSIQAVISSTGTVLPKNRLEIKPPVAGRVESILVKEGDTVAKGQTIGWMSSTERAALLDAAGGQGQEKLKYWQEVYKPIALVAPIDGQVIVATVQPGQTLAAAEAVLVLSDKLIVRAQVDETDIGKVRPGQPAAVTLDAYPDEKIRATVEHIYYESTTVNNVTIYQVDLAAETVPAFFRSGMNAAVDFIVESRDNALLLAQEAVSSQNGQHTVLVRNGQAKDYLSRIVTLGMSQGKDVEILSGLSAEDVVAVRSKKYSVPTVPVRGKNPFLPNRRPSGSGAARPSSGGGGGPPP